MGPRPDIDEHQRPEVDDGEPVGIDGPPRRFRHEVIHDAEHGRGQEEGHRVVPVPPLHQGVLHPAKDGIGMHPTGREREMIDNVEDRHCDDGGDVKPERHIERRLMAPRERPEEVDGEDHPNERHGDVDGPDQFRVFLAASQPQRQRDRRGDDDQLPAPEVELGEKIRREPRLYQPLRRVIDARKEHVPDEGENGGVRVERAEAAEGSPREVEIRLPEGKLRGDEDAHKHADDPPEDGGDEKLPDNAIIEFNGDL